MKRILFFLLYSIIVSCIALPQQKIIGRVTNAVDVPVPFATVINVNKQTGTISDNYGYFKIIASNRDSISLSALGFQKATIVYHSGTDTLYVQLKDTLIEIEQVMVYPFKDYASFRRAVLSLELPDNGIYIPGLPDKRPGPIPILEQEEYISSIGFMINSPISYLYYNFSDKEIDKRRAHALNKQYNQQRQADKKINYEIVSSLIGIRDTVIITDFLHFCDFQTEFVIHTNDYLLASIIVEKWKVYCRENNLDTCLIGLFYKRPEQISGFFHLPLWC